MELLDIIRKHIDLSIQRDALKKSAVKDQDALNDINSELEKLDESYKIKTSMLDKSAFNDLISSLNEIKTTYKFKLEHFQAQYASAGNKVNALYEANNGEELNSYDRNLRDIYNNAGLDRQDEINKLVPKIEKYESFINNLNDKYTQRFGEDVPTFVKK